MGVMIPILSIFFFYVESSWQMIKAVVRMLDIRSRGPKIDSSSDVRSCEYNKEMPQTQFADQKRPIKASVAHCTALLPFR